MADSKISQLTSYTTPLSADVLPIVDTANTTTKKVTMANLFNILSSLFTIKDSSDTTKKVAFSVSGITTGTTRTLTVPDASTTIVGTDATQTLTNKTISTGTKINTSGSDGTGAMYYRDSSGNLTNLGIGSNLQILQSNGTLPQWVANPSASQASYSTAGIVQFSTDAPTSGVFVSGGVASVNYGTGANQIVKLNGSSQLPAVDGSLLTNLPHKGIFKNGTTTKDASDASTTQTIAHGVGTTPKKVRLWGICDSAAAGAGQGANVSFTATYNGTTQSAVSYYANGATPTWGAGPSLTLNAASNTGTQVGTITMDATNISIAWVKTGSPTGIYNILWEAEA